MEKIVPRALKPNDCWQVRIDGNFNTRNHPFGYLSCSFYFRHRHAAIEFMTLLGCAENPMAEISLITPTGDPFSEPAPETPPYDDTIPF